MHRCLTVDQNSSIAAMLMTSYFHINPPFQASLESLFWVPLPSKSIQMTTQKRAFLDCGTQNLDLPPQEDLSASVYCWLPQVGEDFFALFAIPQLIGPHP